jgi:TrwC relaxase
VLSVAKLAPGQERYYEASVARGFDDYYAGVGESPGVWVGAGAASLELVGTVEDGLLGALMRGLHPPSGTLLRRQAAVRRIMVERIDPDTGERQRVK